MPTLRHEVKLLAGMAWPVALGQLAGMSMSLVDTAMVGRVSAEAMASVALGVWWSYAVLIFGFGMLRALDPVVAQAHGAGDETGAGLALARGVGLSLLLSVPTAGLYLLAEPGLRLLGQPEELLPVAGQFSTVFALGAPGMLLFSTVRGVLQARGQMRAPTVAIVLANVVNAAVDYVFVFGNLGAPRLGALGAAIATVSSTWFQLALLVYLERRTLLRLWPGWRRAVELRPLLELARMGLPQGFQMASEVWSFLAAGFLVGTFGSHDLAGHSIVMQLASLSFMVPLGVSTAAATRVGMLIGAGKPWARAAVGAHILGTAFMSLSALTFALLPGPLASLFTSDPDALAMAVILLPIAAAFQLFDGIQVVAFGVLRGAGDLAVPAVANIVGFWVLGLPVGAWLAMSQGLGSRGVWFGLVIGLATVAALLLIRERATLRRGGYRVGLPA